MATSQKIPPTLYTGTKGKNLLDRLPVQYGTFPAAFYKTVALDALLVVSAVAAGYYSFRYAQGGGEILVPLVLLGIFFALSFFETLFVEGLKRRLAVTLLAVAGLLGFFYETESIFLWSAAVAVLFCFLWGEAVSRAEIKNSIKFRLLKFAKPKLSRMATGVVLAGVLIYAPAIQSSAAVISEAQFAKVYQLALGSIEDWYRGLRFTSTLGEFATDIVRVQLERDERFTSLPEDAQREALQEAAARIIENASRGGIAVAPDMPASRFFYAYLLDYVGQIQERLGSSFLLVWAVGAFLVFRSIATVFVWAALVLSYILYEILFTLRLVRMRGENSTKEVVEFI